MARTISMQHGREILKANRQKTFIYPACSETPSFASGRGSSDPRRPPPASKIPIRPKGKAIIKKKRNKTTTPQLFKRKPIQNGQNPIKINFNILNTGVHLKN
jgi:hypothetical protein